METPSPVKRKAATIDLTRSDSEGEAPKRRRRVIEIESESDDDDAPRPTTTMPWETPEWKAHCAKEREGPVAGFLKDLFANVGSRYGPSTDIQCACRGLDKYDMSRCRGSKHLCVCRKLDKYDFNRCKATKHLCTCRQLDKYDRNRCRAVKHLL